MRVSPADRRGPSSVLGLQRRHHGAAISGMAGPAPTMGAASPRLASDRLSGFPDRHSPWLHRNRITRSQSGSHRRNGHNRNAEQRHDMLDLGDFAIGNVRIHRDLRRRRNGREPRRLPPRQRRERQRRREYRRHRECRQPQECWTRRDCRECAAPAQAALLRRRLRRQRRPQRRAAALEPEFRWDLPRLAIWG